MSWNWQGLEKPKDLVISRLKEMRKEHFPEIFFLMDTMNKRDVLGDLQKWLGYDRVFTINPIGRGGFGSFWKNSIEVEFNYVDKNMLDLKAKYGSTSFFVSCVYGDPCGKNKHNVWEMITRLGCNRKEGWCMLGDFNDILHSGEKMGGPLRSDAVCGSFNDMIKACEMSELPSSGNGLTWGGMRYDLWIQCRIEKRVF